MFHEEHPPNRDLYFAALNFSSATSVIDILRAFASFASFACRAADTCTRGHLIEGFATSVFFDVDIVVKLLDE